MTHWFLIPLFAGLVILGGCMVYTWSVRKGPPSGQPFRGRPIVLILTAVSMGLFLYALIGVLTDPAA